MVNDDVHSRHMDAVHNMMYRAAKTISQLCPGLGGGTVGLNMCERVGCLLEESRKICRSEAS